MGLFVSKWSTLSIWGLLHSHSNMHALIKLKDGQRTLVTWWWCGVSGGAPKSGNARRAMSFLGVGQSSTHIFMPDRLRRVLLCAFLLQACMSKFSEHDRSIVVKALDIPESSPHAICEQIYINGLDAYLSQLAQHNKLEPLAKGMRFHTRVPHGYSELIYIFHLSCSQILSLAHSGWCLAALLTYPWVQGGPLRAGTPLLWFAGFCARILGRACVPLLHNSCLWSLKP